MVNRTGWTSTLLGLLLLASLLPFAGCESREEEAYRIAYEASYSAHQRAGFRQGEARGQDEGTQAGMAAALVAAESGQAWELYTNLGLGALLSGLMLGLIVQFGILSVCRRTGRLPQFSTVAFVPAMKFTVAYTVFERRQAVMMEIDEQLREIAERKNLQVAKILQLKEVMALKIKALSSLDELSQARLLELAEEELEKIVSASEKKAESILNFDQSETRITHICPHCQSLVRFNLRSMKETVTCPNQECSQPIKLPQSLYAGAPSILDVID